MRVQGPKNLQVMWGVHKFRLENSTCSNDPAIDPGSPATPFDTLQGSGTGRYDNGTGFLASFTFTDAGEPGLNDTARIKITTQMAMWCWI